VKQCCADRLAAYKQPRHIEIVEALPRTATGKLLRRALKIGTQA
jgi:acyl-coenzyme A synthetase/AMP-(fatty) acid ligase